MPSYLFGSHVQVGSREEYALSSPGFAHSGGQRPVVSGIPTHLEPLLLGSVYSVRRWSRLASL